MPKLPPPAVIVLLPLSISLLTVRVALITTVSLVASSPNVLLPLTLRSPPTVRFLAIPTPPSN